MNYEEFKKWDEFGVYSDYISVELAEQTEEIPRPFIGIFSKTCKCGSDMLIKIDNSGKSHLKSIMCCNNNCRIKIAHSMSDMFTNFSIKGLGYETCQKITDYCLNQELFTIPSHTEIMNIQEDSPLQYILGAKWFDLYQAVTYIRESPMTFPQMLSRICIPFFDKDSERIFSEIKSVEELVNIEKTWTIRRYLDVNGVHDEKALKSLIDHLMDIYTFEESLIYGLKKPGLELKEIAVTGSVKVNGVKFSRPQFIDYCSAIGNCNGVQLFTVKDCKAFKSVSYTVADEASSSPTYTAGVERQKHMDRKFLVTAQEYVEILKEEVKECKKLAMKQLEKAENQMT